MFFIQESHISCPKDLNIRVASAVISPWTNQPSDVDSFSCEFSSLNRENQEDSSSRFFTHLNYGIWLHMAAYGI